MSEETGSAEAGNPQTEAPVAPAAVEAAPSILDSFQDQDLRSYAEGKGFDKAGFEGLVKSYSHLEKMTTNKDSTVVIPGLDAPLDQTDAFYNRLGRPEAPDGYAFQLPEGSDTARLDGLRAAAHQLGLSDKQFSGLAEADSAYFSGITEQSTQNNEMAATDADNALRQEWGAAYDQNVAGVERYADQLGMSQEQLVGLRDSMGPVEAMKFVHGLGGKLGEAPMDYGEAGQSNLLTPAAASEELRGLTSDPQFMEAWLNKGHPQHNDMMEKKARLSRQAAGGQP